MVTAMKESSRQSEETRVQVSRKLSVIIPTARYFACLAIALRSRQSLTAGPKLGWSSSQA